MDTLALRPLADGFCFGEGPRWFEGLLWFSDMLGEAVHTVDLDGLRSALQLPGHRPSGLGFRP
ncbi:MAG: SMP-30/gluconolactonase/LRE family protein, partial [Mycobacterium sp.]